MQEEFQQQSDSAHPLDPEVSKQLREEIKRYLRDANRSFFRPRREARLLFEKSLRTYLASHSHKGFHTGMVYLLAPFVLCMDDKADIYYCFTSLSEYLGTFLFFSLSLPTRFFLSRSFLLHHTHHTTTDGTSLHHTTPSVITSHYYWWHVDSVIAVVMSCTT